MKKNLLLLFFVIICVSLPAEDLVSKSKIIYDYDSEFYDELYLSCMEDGITMLSYRKPASVSELALNYKKINVENLSLTGTFFYNNLTTLFSPKPAFVDNQFGFDYNIHFALEGRYLYNPDKEPNIDKIYRYNDSFEVINFPLELYLSPYIFGYSVMTLGKNYGAYNISYPYTNLPFVANALDYHFPKNAGLAFGNDFFNVHIGRGRLTVGKTLSGSMLISDSADRLDFFSANVFFDHFKYDLTIAEIRPTQFFITHEFSIRPVKQISITVHEGIMLDSVFDPKFLNPFMIFHNYAAWKQGYVGHMNDENSIGCQLGLDINIVPIKNLRIYGQFAFNQFQTPSEVASGATSIPNSMGGNIGIEYVLPALNGHFIFATEFLHADPWLYIGYGGINASFFGYRKENVYATENYDKSRIDFWLANPYGPDTMAGFLNVDFIYQNKFKLGLSYRFLCKGENEKKFLEHAHNGDKKYYPTEEEPKHASEMVKWKTPSNNPMYFNTIKLYGQYNIIKGLNLKSHLSWTIASGNLSGHSVDFSTALSYSLR